MTSIDKETILFEIGFVWGVCSVMCTDKPEVFDSIETIKEIIERYKGRSDD